MPKKITSNSILTNKLNEIFECKEIDTCKTIFRDIVESSKINDFNKRQMLYNIDTINTLIGLQSYAANSCMKFNGLGV